MRCFLLFSFAFLLWTHPSAALFGEIDASRTVTKARASSPEGLLAAAFVAAQNVDEKAGFDVYKKLVHPDRRTSAISVVQLRRYSWKRFRQQAKDYILTGTKDGYIIVREEPTKRAKDTKHVRLFVDPVNNTRRSYPVPVRFKKHEGRWYILSNSL